MALLDVQDLEVFYGKSCVVNGVSFELERNAVVSLVGPNGAGKTSILDSVFNYTEWTGEIRYDEKDVRDRSPEEVSALGVSYCMEEGNLFPYMTVRQNLLTGAHRNRKVAEETLAQVHDLFPILEERADQIAKTLSGGQQQMLAIGKSLMADPELLIIDEPTLGLAPVVIDDIADAIGRLREELTILLVEQDVAFGFEHADEILLIETGNIVMRGHPDNLRDHNYVNEAYLGMPDID